ncbi:MAG: protein-L-isoaspartate(D-aspartate) O-methyltransferase [Nitrospiria bacterium]
MIKDQLVSRGIRDHRVLEVMGKVPRHLFVEEALQYQAYGDHPLPIGKKQTISQPYMVALMTEALELHGTEKILEIGTGSGYQTAILAELADQVFSIERVQPFVERAQNILKGLNYLNVTVQHSDGTTGWREQAPFDRILVAAGSPEIPHVLIEQLKPGGRLVIPIGGRSSQTLQLIVKERYGFLEKSLTACAFVPLVGALGWKSENEKIKKIPI